MLAHDVRLRYNLLLEGMITVKEVFFPQSLSLFIMVSFICYKISLTCLQKSITKMYCTKSVSCFHIPNCSGDQLSWVADGRFLFWLISVAYLWALLTCLGLGADPLLMAKQSETFPEAWSTVTCRSWETCSSLKGIFPHLSALQSP